MYPSARYGRPRRDDRYEPDVVYVEDRRAPRRYDDYNDDRLRRSYEHRRETERETERERELQGELRRTRRVLLEMRQERAAVSEVERPRFAMSPKRRGDAVQGFAERRDDYDDEFVVVERRRRDDDVSAERRLRDDPVVVWQAPRRDYGEDERDAHALAPLPRRDWFHDGYSRDSRRHPGSRRQRYSQEGWRAPRDDRPDAASWEWCGRSIRSEPPLPPRVEPPRVKSTRQKQEEAVERLEKLCLEADKRAKRAEERQEALAKQLTETRRDLEKVAESTGTPVKKRVEKEEEDEFVDVDALKAENDALKAKLASIGEAAAAIDA